MRKYFCLLYVSLCVSGYGQTLPTAMQTYKSMTIGWNIGNTLEAIGGETAWGNPLVTQRLIDSVKAAGFNTIRIPCCWDTHANQTTLQIDPTWMIRITQVVNYCINKNLYVILNIHWDGGWLENNCTPAMQTSVNLKQNSYWTQIANNFKNYDGHLLFASANEPNVNDATQMAVLLSYHQTFVNAVRATGGNNSSRVLVIQGPGTDIDKTNTLMNTLPTDNISNRLMVEIHDYTPFNFCLMTTNESWGNMFYYWGTSYHSSADPTHNATWGEESFLDSYFNLMKTKYVDNCIPVIIGEFGAIKRLSLTGPALSLHLASREYFYRYTSNAARRYGLRLVCWDIGSLGDNNMTLFNRNTGAIVDRGTVNALMTGFATATDPLSGCIVLPVNLLSFTVKKITNYATTLNWTTSEEINFSHFEIERSEDGINFSKIGILKMPENASKLNTYQFLDEQAFSCYKVLYYRLNTVDLDGILNHSNILKIENQDNLFEIYPNPIIRGETAVINVHIPFTEEDVSISIINPLGSKLYSFKQKNNERLNVNTELLVPGIYIIELISGTERKFKKLMIE